MSIAKNLHLLVVEDQLNTRKLLVQTLRGLHFDNIHEAEDGEQAWEILSKKTIHIVLLDLIMPVMDGFGFLQKVRASDSPDIQKLPVLVITSQGEKDSIVRAAQYNIQGYIVKPFDSKGLLRKIKEICTDGLADSSQKSSVINLRG